MVSSSFAGCRGVCPTDIVSSSAFTKTFGAVGLHPLSNCALPQNQKELAMQTNCREKTKKNNPIVTHNSLCFYSICRKHFRNLKAQALLIDALIATDITPSGYSLLCWSFTLSIQHSIRWLLFTLKCSADIACT